MFNGRWRWVGFTKNEDGTKDDIYEDELFGTGYMTVNEKTGEQTRYTNPEDRN